MCLQFLLIYHNTLTETQKLQEWVSIYFAKINENEFRCNICEQDITIVNLVDQLDHIKVAHKEIYDIHKENPEASVGFRIEFLQVNVLKDDAQKLQPVVLDEVCETATEEVSPPSNMASDGSHSIVKKKKRETGDNRKRSWVWKYFARLSSIIFRCNLCHVVLSIKGCNTNNMNRHIRTKHPGVYHTEVSQLKKPVANDEIHVPIMPSSSLDDMETPFVIKVEEIVSSNKRVDEALAQTRKRRSQSWVWAFFTRLSETQAECKVCQRKINHGGNATGNMNRHVKMIHPDSYMKYMKEETVKPDMEDTNWVWKVFGNEESDFYNCKICQYRCFKFSELEKSVTCILDHLKTEHGVISGDQIITGNEFDDN